MDEFNPPTWLWVAAAAVDAFIVLTLTTVSAFGIAYKICEKISNEG